MTHEQKEYDAISFEYGKRLFAHSMGNLFFQQGAEKVREELRKVLDPEAMEPFEQELDLARLELLIMQLEPADPEGCISFSLQRG